jgi:hypothetical protein
MPKKKYATLEERRLAGIEAAKKFYQDHKNEPEFMEKRRGYYKKYYSGLSEVRKKAYRSYNSEYSFYMRSVLTGRFEKKIIKNKQRLKDLEQKIFEMEQKLIYMKNKFGHLEHKGK